MQKTRLTYLLDAQNNWIEQPLRASAIGQNYDRFQVSITHDPAEIHGEDIVFILSYTKILPEEFLTQNTLNIVAHASDLPRGKGFAPVQWQILEGKNTIPICLIEAVAAVDARDILLRIGNNDQWPAHFHLDERNTF